MSGSVATTRTRYVASSMSGRPAGAVTVADHSVVPSSCTSPVHVGVSACAHTWSPSACVRVPAGVSQLAPAALTTTDSAASDVHVTSSESGCAVTVAASTASVGGSSTDTIEASDCTGVPPVDTLTASAMRPSASSRPSMRSAATTHAPVASVPPITTLTSSPRT